MLTHAISRLPGANFADGLTTVDFGVPNFELVLAQHAAYCEALRECGLQLTILEADLQHPDSTFVEDTAVLVPQAAVLTRPGAASRLGEVAAIRPSIAAFYSTLLDIEAPGTLDGGDICEAGTHFFLGVSHRTNEVGAAQLAAHLALYGYTSSVVNLRSMTSILHLKSGISYIGDNTLVLMEEMVSNPCFANYNIIRVSPEESYAANCVLVNNRVLIPKGYPGLAAALRVNGFNPLSLDMSEYRKMDGGLSCLSLRF